MKWIPTIYVNWFRFLMLLFYLMKYFDQKLKDFSDFRLFQRLLNYARIAQMIYKTKFYAFFIESYILNFNQIVFLFAHKFLVFQIIYSSDNFTEKKRKRNFLRCAADKFH